MSHSMTIQQSLYDGKLIRLGPIDFDKDPEIEARWTNDSGFLRALFITPAIPRSPAKVKKTTKPSRRLSMSRRTNFISPYAAWKMITC